MKKANKTLLIMGIFVVIFVGGIVAISYWEPPLPELDKQQLGSKMTGSDVYIDFINTSHTVKIYAGYFDLTPDK